jgi:hypothetical protein
MQSEYLSYPLNLRSIFGWGMERGLGGFNGLVGFIV